MGSDFYECQKVLGFVYNLYRSNGISTVGIFIAELSRVYEYFLILQEIMLFLSQGQFLEPFLVTSQIVFDLSTTVL